MRLGKKILMYFTRKNNVIEATYTLGTGLPLREVKEGKDVGYRSQLLGSVHQVEFLVTPKYQGIKVNIKFEEVKVYPEGFAAFINLVMDNDLNVINKELIDKANPYSRYRWPFDRCSSH